MLADGDIFAYNAAINAQSVAEFDGMYLSFANMDEAKAKAMSYLKAVAKEIKAKEIVFVRSPSSRKYWRHDVFPEYKSTRSDVKPPLVLDDLKHWLTEQFESHMWEGFEADDVLGILATDPKYKPGKKKVVVSIDKDMNTLPCWQFNPDKDYQPWLQSREDADIYHLMQAIGGDTTDGYKGCKGVGVDTALAFLKDPWYWEQYEHIYKSGKRKGEVELKWRKADPRPDLWENIVSLFHKAGQTEEDALTNARVARILRHEDVDGREVNLWTPERLK